MNARVQGIQFIDFIPLPGRALEKLIDTPLVCAHDGVLRDGAVGQGESCSRVLNCRPTELCFFAKARYSIPADLKNGTHRSASRCSLACAYVAIVPGSKLHFRNTKGPNPMVVP